jgi:small-conductance mechanosensitive channel
METFAMTLLGFTFSTIWAVIVLLIWIAFAFWPARVAGRKGYSFLGFFILSLFFFFIALIIAYILPNRMRQSAGQPQSTVEPADE